MKEIMSDIKKTIDNFIRDHGAWTAHNYLLSDNVYTISSKITGDEFKLRRIIQNISDFSKKPFNELKIFDLACLEGLYAIECARLGAETVALDIRQKNLDKIKFVKELLGLDKLFYVKDDIRNISLKKYGCFDVVLCLGIFYHLDREDLLPVIQRMYDITTNLVILDTHISMKRSMKFIAQGIEYYGSSYREHRKDVTEEERQNDTWKSFDNEFSFVLTKESLLRMLQVSGFTSSAISLLPAENNKPYNRITVIASKGQPVKSISAPLINELPDERLEESDIKKYLSHYYQITYNNFLSFLRMNTPRKIKKLIKKIKSS
ncbi:MAG: hypothetical protein QG635_1836 [Bacteroidota bacterium]|nr:hypothetical protein [Bacteroidota bacterium]